VRKTLSLAQRDLADALTARIQYARHHLMRLGRSISQSSTRLVARKKALLGTSAARLNALSPLATLSRGYAVARDEHGRALTSARQFSPGLDFDLLLRDGRIAARTEKVSIDENSDAAESH
jgi:exodeoxyribonuclease VII large subunit